MAKGRDRMTESVMISDGSLGSPMRKGKEKKDGEGETRQALPGVPYAGTAASAIRSLARLRTLADLSWPQAAMMSSPRGVRTGEA